MTIVFYARYLTHHLTSLCDTFVKLTNNCFYFVETENIPKSTLELGYKDLGATMPYCINVHRSDKEKQLAFDLAKEADVAIIGCGAYQFMHHRIENGNKLTFKLKERLFKNGIEKRFLPEVKADMYKKHQQYMDKNVYYLCAGAFTAVDFAYLGLNTERFFRWGYFPPLTYHEKFRESYNEKIKMLWVGRFIADKHPIIPLRALKQLVSEGYNIELNFLGSGELKPSMEKYIHKNKLDEYVNFLGSVPFEEVRRIMFDSDLFLMTSDYREGWGAVVSEAMNEGCICISSLYAGATCFLIENGKNGFYYYNTSDLVEVIKEALSRTDLIDIKTQSYSTIVDLWNGVEAATRLFEVSKSIINKGTFDFYKDGPMSRAPIIKNALEVWKKYGYNS